MRGLHKAMYGPTFHAVTDAMDGMGCRPGPLCPCAAAVGAV